MDHKKLALYGLASSLATIAYVFLVSLLIFNGEKLFGKMEGILAALSFLLLFVFSAAMTGLLVLGRPAYLFFNGAKKEAIGMLGYSLGWLFIFLVIIFLFLIF